MTNIFSVDKFKKNYLYVGGLVLIAIWIIALNIEFAFFQPVDFSQKGIFVYFVMSLIPLVLIGVFGIRSMKNKTFLTKFCYIGLLVFIFIFIIFHASYETGDYFTFLNPWTQDYRSVGLKDAIYHITDISNYTHDYNYFLIVIAKLNFNQLFAIKYVTFAFSFLLAFAIEKIIGHFLNEKFDFFRFVLVLVLPPIMLEYTAWGQCDAIYTSLAMLSFLFALKKKSKLSFMFIGLSFAFKLQFLFIVPVLFVMLIIKDKDGKHYLKWKDIWIAPLMYIINFAPVLVGRPVIDILSVYFGQASSDKRISGNCANICAIYYLAGIKEYSPEYMSLILAQTALTIFVLILLFAIVFVYHKKIGVEQKDLVFFGMLFAFVMVFFMPKMLDRFYYIAMLFAFVNAVIDKKISNKISLVLICNSLFFMMSLHFSYFMTFATAITSYFMGFFSAYINLIILVGMLTKRYIIPLKKKISVTKEKEIPA